MKGVKHRADRGGGKKTALTGWKRRIGDKGKNESKKMDRPWENSRTETRPCGDRTREGSLAGAMKARAANAGAYQLERKMEFHDRYWKAEGERLLEHAGNGKRRKGVM